MKPYAEARRLWCPFTRAGYGTIYNSGSIGLTYNRDLTGHPPTQCRCIASLCMAWEWDETQRKSEYKAKKNAGLRRGQCQLMTRPT